jgi:probable HAF family extracellular repeat protein
MKVRPFAVLIAVAAVAFAQSRSVSTQPAPADQYLITDLGTLGGTRSDAFAISEIGQVAGSAERSDGSTHAFFFDQSMHDLGTIGGANSVATDLNQKGQVVGWSESAAGNTKGFIYSAGVRRSFGTLGGSDSAAYGINVAGDVVGSATTTGNAATRAFLYRNGAMKSLGTLGGSNSAATAISEGGDVTGWSSLPGNGFVHAFLIPSGRPMIDLGTLGGDSHGLGVNQSGEVVGRSVVASGATHAFFYTGGTMIDLGTLGGRNSEATGLNEIGQVVGWSERAGVAGTHAFLYAGGVMTDLNTRVPAGAGWVLESATGIDTGGDIVGVGTINGRRHAYRLSLRVALTLSAAGPYSDEVSNFPSNGVQVGRTILLVATVRASDGNALNVVLTDTLEGPIEVQSASTFLGGVPCEVSGRVVTCRIPVLGPWYSSDEEIHVVVRVTGPGPFSHTAHVTADNAVANASDTLTEHNIGVALKSFALSATTVAGGTAVSARAELTSLPPSSGARVTLESSNPAIAPVPSTFVVQGSSAVRTFNIVPAVVAQPTTVTITATYGLVTIAQTLTVVPPSLSVLSLTRSTMIGACQTAIAKVTLNGSAPPSGASVTLSSTTPGLHVPAAVTIGPGETSVSVTVTADAVHTLSKGVFAAAFGGTRKELPLAVRPIYLTSVTVSPSSVTGGSTATATATIECAAPAGGMAGTVTSTNPAAATPATGSVNFAAGATTTSVAIRTNPVGSVTTPAIRVAVNGVTKSAALEVKP